MSDKEHRITRNDCLMIIEKLISILRDAGLGDDFDFIAYGSYFSGWRDGLSDLDAILYFKNSSFVKLMSKDRIHKIQSGLTALYENIAFLKTSNFFADVFILDKFHGRDGRFIMFDLGFIERLKIINKNYTVVYGNNFLDKLKPVFLRHQDEFDLALGLHKIRNYLLFEIPRLISRPFPPSTKEALKFLKTLGRTANIVLNEPINPIREGFDSLSRKFPHIDYAPMYDLCQKTLNSNALQEYLEDWHNGSFVDCWFCWEQTLATMVKNFPARSLK